MFPSSAALLSGRVVSDMQYDLSKEGDYLGRHAGLQAGYNSWAQADVVLSAPLAKVEAICGATTESHLTQNEKIVQTWARMGTRHTSSTETGVFL